MPIPINWPASGLDTLPKPTSLNYTDDVGFYLDELCTAYSTLLEQMEAAFGYTPTANDSVGMLRMLTAAGNKGLALPIAQLGPSLIVNGNFDVWQQTAGNVTTHGAAYNAISSYNPDQFYCLPGGASVTSQRVTGTPDAKSSYSWRLNGAAGVTTVDVGQRIRSAYKGRYQQSLVFSCWVFNPGASAFTPNLRVDCPTVADNWAASNNRLDQGLQTCAAGAWTRVHTVFNPSAYTDIANGMAAYLRLPSGVMGAGAQVNIAQFDLRPGTQMMDYLPPDPDVELARARMYYEKWGGASTVEQAGIGQCYGNNAANITCSFEPKWTAPVLWIPTVGKWGITNASGVVQAATSWSLAAAGNSRAIIQVGVAGTPLVPGNATYMGANSDATAEMHWYARL